MAFDDGSFERVAALFAASWLGSLSERADAHNAAATDLAGAAQRLLIPAAKIVRFSPVGRR
jgi:hypothetical protein